MKTVSLSDLFRVEYGNKFDLNKMVENERGQIAFIGRVSTNNGVTAFVEKVHDVQPHHSGLITVNLGGAILESYLQIFPFYTAQNVAVLTAMQKMTEREKLFYCFAIHANRFRYGAFGREANRTLRQLQVPARVPRRFLEMRFKKPSTIPVAAKKIALMDRPWQWFPLNNLFSFAYGQHGFSARHILELSLGRVPLISSTGEANGVLGYYNIQPRYQNVISIARTGSVGESFYHNEPCCINDDCIVLTAKGCSMNAYIGLFLSCLLRREKYRYSYGRKVTPARLESLKLKLPIASNGQPDWQFMEDFIKSLPYSSAIA